MQAQLLLLLCCLLLVSSSPLKYELYQETTYKVFGRLDAVGSDSVTGAVTQNGSTSTLEAQFITNCIGADDRTGIYNLKGNLYWTTVFNGKQEKKLYSLLIPNLGDSVYFDQHRNGTISGIVISKSDSPYATQVKTGVLNAMNIHIVNENQVTEIKDEDLVGAHTSKVRGASETVGNVKYLKIDRSYNQDSITRFTDPNLKPSNLKLNAKSVSRVHVKGYIHRASFDQDVKITNLGSGKGASTSAFFVGGGNMNPVDMQVNSVGSLTVDWLSSRVIDINPGTKRAERWAMSEIPAGSHMHVGSLSNAARYLMEAANLQRATEHDTEPALKAVFKNDAADVINQMNQVSTVMSLLPERIPLLEKYIRVENMDRLMHIVSSIDHPKAEALFLNRILSSSNKLIRDWAVFSAHHLLSASDKTLASLASIQSDAALLAYGSVASRVPSASSKKFLMEKLSDARRGGNIESLKAATHALRNAGVHLNLQSLAVADGSNRRSRDIAFSLGGKTIGANLTANAYFDSNWNCKNDGFNLQVGASAEMTLNLYNLKTSALKAGVSFSTASGSVTDHVAYLEVFGKTVQNIQLPVPKCIGNSRNLTSLTKGARVQYMVWVSVIPISFSADATLSLNLGLKWEICPLALTASTQLIPTASLTINSRIEIDLLLVKTASVITGSFIGAATPELYIDGSRCDAGFKVTEITEPMDVRFQTSFQWRECKILWLFDCEMLTQNLADVFLWELRAPVNKVILSQHFLGKKN